MLRQDRYFVPTFTGDYPIIWMKDGNGFTTYRKPPSIKVSGAPKRRKSMMYCSYYHHHHPLREEEGTLMTLIPHCKYMLCSKFRFAREICTVWLWHRKHITSWYMESVTGMKREGYVSLALKYGRRLPGLDDSPDCHMKDENDKRRSL